jgi:hypothetical protein
VVELEDDRIALAAIDAGALLQVLQDIRLQRSHPSLLRCPRLIAVEVAARAEVLGKAGSAPPLQPVAEAVEGLQGQFDATSAAAAHPA